MSTMFDPNDPSWFARAGAGNINTSGGVSPTVPPAQMGGSTPEQPAITTAQQLYENPVTTNATSNSIFGPNVQQTPNTQGNAGQDGGGNSASNSARITMYNGKDDQFGSETAAANRFGKLQAVPGETIAVDPSKIPYGSYVHIPGTEDLSAHKDGIWYAHDTGSAVKSEEASGGKIPTIDIYTPGNNLNDPKWNKDFNYQVLSKPPAWATSKA